MFPGATFDRAQRAIIDLASRMGGDLTGATVKVGRALNDPIQGTQALTRMGVQFDTQTKLNIISLVRHGEGLKAQGIILDALERKFHGSAEAMRAADPELVFKNDWQDFSETIGRIEAQVLPLFTDKLRDVLKWFQSLEPETQKNIVLIAGLAAAMGPFLVVAANAIKLIAALATGLRILAVAAAANPWIALVALIGLAAGAVYLLATRTTDAKKAIDSQADAHRTLNKLLDDAKAKGDRLSESDANSGEAKAEAGRSHAEGRDRAAAAKHRHRSGRQRRRQLPGENRPEVFFIASDPAGNRKPERAEQGASAKPGRSEGAGRGAGGEGRSCSWWRWWWRCVRSPQRGRNAEGGCSCAALGNALDEMAIHLQHGLDSTNMPKAIADADALNAQIDEYVKTAQQAGANTGQFDSKIAGLRATIEQLKIAELAKEAKAFTEAVDADAVAVDKFAKGGLTPLQAKLRDVDDQFRSLRDKITDEIEVNRVLAEHER
jgi:hypothetical protein